MVQWWQDAQSVGALLSRVTINTLSHLQFCNLRYLFHRGNVAVTGGTYSGRTNRHSAGLGGKFLKVLRYIGVGVLRQVANVRLMHKADMVRHSVHTFPIDGMRVIADDPSRGPDLRQRFAVFTTNHLVAIRTELDCRHARIGLHGYGSVTECAVHAETLHTLANRVGVSPSSGVDGVRERYWLFNRLIEAQHWYRLL